MSYYAVCVNFRSMNATEHVCIEKLCVDQEREKIGRNQIKLESMKWAIPFESHTPSVEDLEKHLTLGDCKFQVDKACLALLQGVQECSVPENAKFYEFLLQ